MKSILSYLFHFSLLYFSCCQNSTQEEGAQEATPGPPQPIFINQISKNGRSVITSLLYNSRRKPYAERPKPIIPKMRSSLSENEDSNYVKYTLFTPSVPGGVPIQNFFVDLVRDTLTVRSRYFNNKTMTKHNITKAEDYRAVVYLDYPVRPGTIPVISKEKQKDDTLKIEVKISKLAYSSISFSFDRPTEETRVNIKDYEAVP